MTTNKKVKWITNIYVTRKCHRLIIYVTHRQMVQLSFYSTSFSLISHLLAFQAFSLQLVQNHHRN